MLTFLSFRAFRHFDCIILCRKKVWWLNKTEFIDQSWWLLKTIWWLNPNRFCWFQLLLRKSVVDFREFGDCLKWWLKLYSQILVILVVTENKYCTIFKMKHISLISVFTFTVLKLWFSGLIGLKQRDLLVDFVGYSKKVWWLEWNRFQLFRWWLKKVWWLNPSRFCWFQWFFKKVWYRC